jgi:hypothetical protein
VYYQNATSYSIIAREICRVNEWECKLIASTMWFPPEADMFIGSQYDIVRTSSIKPRRLAYITVEGEFSNLHAWQLLGDLCSRVRCYVPTRWGKALLEAHNVKVQDVIPHALPEPIPPGPPGERPLDVVYLNARYRLHCQNRFGLYYECDECERKGWRFWREIREAFQNSLGFVSGCDETGSAVGFRAQDTADVYRLLALGRVYAHLSTHEGFGLNPLMAAAMGTVIVSWDIVPTREVLPEAVFVPAPYCTECYLYPFDFTARGKCRACWGDTGEFIETVRKALKSPPQVDWQAVRQKYSARKLYTKFA